MVSGIGPTIGGMVNGTIHTINGAICIIGEVFLTVG
jgi:hypothetical protein